MGQPPKYVMRDGELIEYGEARLHILSTSTKYGVGVFEGFRAYLDDETGQLFAFRIADHMRRLIASMRVVGIDGPTDTAALESQLLELIRVNGLREDLHMRAQVFVEAEDGKPDDTGPAHVYLAAIPMGRYFDRPGLNIQISTWARISDQAMPPRVKSIANYQNGRLALLEARRNGFDAALLLTGEGRVSEGAGYNVFIVRDGKLCTPPSTESILEGITRDSLLHLARTELDVEVVERPIDRTELYSAEEIFVCGSAAEVSPVSSVDRLTVGDGGPGAITTALQELYQRAVRGKVATDRGWARAVYAAEPVGV